MNPLDTGEEFSIELMNPNPTSSKTKAGPVYRVSFEVHRDVWDCFMDAETGGMVLEGALQVTAQNAPLEAPEKPKGGPLSKAAAMLCQDDKANEYAEILGQPDFQHLIYDRCRIKSRAELDHDSYAAAQYEELKRSFIRWAF